MAKYNIKNSYLVYTKPKIDRQSFFYFISKIIGGFSFVIDGKQFKYKSGILKEIKHVESKKSMYFLSKRGNLKKARLRVGNKWTIFNNCFTTFIFGIR